MVHIHEGVTEDCICLRLEFYEVVNVEVCRESLLD